MPQTQQKSPDDWAKSLYPPDSRERWRHDVAAAAHGWRQHAHETGKELQLSQEDYTAAVDAASSGKLHEPALSEHSPAKTRIDNEEPDVAVEVEDDEVDEDPPQDAEPSAPAKPSVPNALISTPPVPKETDQ
jgi:hypothetical protein